MRQKQSDGIIFWLVDPFSKHAELQRSAAMVIRSYTEHKIAQVIPIHFFSAYFTGEFPLSLPREWILEIKQKAQEALNLITHDLVIPGLKPLHVVARPYFSIRESIGYLNRLTQRLKNVELVVTSTHGRRGLARFFLGSFAETLLLHLRNTPTLLVNPAWKRNSDFKTILFPTDFSSESKAAFLRLLPLLKPFRSRVTLVHKIAFAWPPALMITLDVAPAYEKTLEAEREMKRREAQIWIHEGRRRGIEVHSVMNSHTEDSVEESILDYAKGKHAILALASQSGPLSTTLIGSTTRNLVRSSLDPVWVIPPLQEESQTQVRPETGETAAEVRREVLGITGEKPLKPAA